MQEFWDEKFIWILSLNNMKCSSHLGKLFERVKSRIFATFIQQLFGIFDWKQTSHSLVLYLSISFSSRYNVINKALKFYTRIGTDKAIKLWTSNMRSHWKSCMSINCNNMKLRLISVLLEYLPLYLSTVYTICAWLHGVRRT